MLVRQGNTISGQTARWRAALNGMGAAVVGLALFAPFIGCMVYDGLRDFHDAGFYSLILPFAVAGLALFWVAWHFGLRKVFQPDELAITISGLAITRLARCKTYSWSDLAEPRASFDGRAGWKVDIKDLRNKKTLRIDADSYGCRGDELSDIIKSARGGQLIDSYEWRVQNNVPHGSAFATLLTVACPMVVGVVIILLNHHR